MERGYVKLWRKIEDSAVFDDAELLRLWLWLMVKANRRPRQISTGETIPNGSVTVSVRDMADRFHCGKSTIARRLEKLEALGMVVVKAGHRFSVVTLCNWNTYQPSEQEQRDASGTQAGRKRDASGTQAGHQQERREGTRGRERKKWAKGETNGSSKLSSPERHSSPSSPSPKIFGFGKEGESQAVGESLDVSGIDWEHVVAIAEAIGKRIRPATEEDRRAWLRFAVLAEVSFGEAWVIDAAEAVVNAKETRKTRQAHFVGVLQSKAKEQHEVDKATFVAMLRRIEIPTSVWKSGVLELRK